MSADQRPDPEPYLLNSRLWARCPIFEMQHWGRQSWDSDTDRRRIQRPPNLEAVGAVRGAWAVRWLKFNAVGAIGVIVQLLALTLLVRVLRLPIVAATGLAVETAIIHNFVWHRGWTWADRKRCGACGRVVEALGALMRFNLTAGLGSLLGNMLLLPMLVGAAGVGLFKADLMTIATCTCVHFMLTD